MSTFFLAKKELGTMQVQKNLAQKIWVKQNFGGKKYMSKQNLAPKKFGQKNWC